MHQKAGKWTTPYGPNVRYTVRIRVVGVRVDDLGGVRPVDQHVDYRVVTPVSANRAVALAALDLEKREPKFLWQDIEVVEVEYDFVHDDDEFRDSYSWAR